MESWPTNGTLLDAYTAAAEETTSVARIAVVYMAATISSIVVGSTLWSAARVPGCDIIVDRLQRCVFNWRTVPARSFYEAIYWMAVTYSVGKAYTVIPATLLGTGICIISCASATLFKNSLKIGSTPGRTNVTTCLLLHPLLVVTLILLLVKGMLSPLFWCCFSCLFMWTSERVCNRDVVAAVAEAIEGRIRRVTLTQCAVVGVLVAGCGVVNVDVVSVVHLCVFSYCLAHVSLETTEAKTTTPTPTPHDAHRHAKHPKNRIIRSTAPGSARIGVAGNWYDVEAFLPHHPGGSVLKEFYGLDATLQFEAFHKPEVLKRFTPCGSYTFKLDDPLEEDFRVLSAKLEEEGFYAPPTQWYMLKIAFNVALIAASYFFMATNGGDGGGGGGMLMGVVVPGVLLGVFWQQAAFFAHDFYHNSVFGKRKVDQAHGWFWGNICVGLSGDWWRVEHFEHHFFTNTVIPGVGCSDPQQHEAGLFNQDTMLSEFLPHSVCRWVVGVQHITFLPVMFFLGRFGICIASYTMQEGQAEWAGVALHYAFLTAFFTAAGTWLQVVGVWYVAAFCGQGLLALQLCLSHYDKPFAEKDEVKGGWCRRQTAVIKDVSCPVWLDWIHGGLNLHIVHHLFPRLPRSRFREVNVLVLELVRKHGVHVDVESFSAATASVLKHLRAQSFLV